MADTTVDLDNDMFLMVNRGMNGWFVSLMDVEDGPIQNTSYGPLGGGHWPTKEEAVDEMNQQAKDHKKHGIF